MGVIFTPGKLRNLADEYGKIVISLGNIIVYTTKIRNLLDEHGRVGILVMCESCCSELEKRVLVVKYGKIEIGKFHNFGAEIMQFLKNWVVQKAK